MFASSCQKGEGGLDPNNPQMRNVTLNASLAETKVALSGAQLQWEDGDEIALVFPHETESWYVSGLSATIEGTPTSAKFKGAIDKDVTVDNGYAATGFAVYPRTAVAGDGSFAFDLPAVQTAAATVEKFAGIQKGINLTSGNVPLKKIVNKGETDSYFKNACSILRFTLAEGVASMTLTGTSNLAGQAPLVLNGDGRLVVDAEGAWANGSKSVTIKPSNGEGFEDGTAYNLLVWPGVHTALTLTVDYVGDFGSVSKTTQLEATFEPSKYYTLNFNVSSDVLLKELDGALDNMIDGLTKFEGRLEEAEGNVYALLAQVQSVTLMTDYLDNSAYAHYSMFGTRPEKLNVALDYIIKPESAAYALVKAFEVDNSILSGVVRYPEESSFADLSVADVVVNEAPFGKYVTVSFDATNIDDKFYTESRATSLALRIASDKTDIISDFAKLTPREGSTIKADHYEEIPVIPGARMVIPFSYAVSDPNATYQIKVASLEGAGIMNAYMNKYYTDLKTGNFTVVASDDISQIGSAKVTLALLIGTGENQEVITKDFTFKDSGERVTFDSFDKVDCIGGDVVVDPIVTENIKNPIVNSCTNVSNVGNIFTFGANTGVERVATIEYKFNVDKVPFDYYKSVSITQKAAGAPIDETQYYKNGDRVILNAANASGCANYLNIVILGDGYVKSDLKKGDGLFERRARSAMDSFFAIEPYKTFKDRFNVYMVAYESRESGTDIKSGSVVEKDTYFGSYCQGGGNTAAYVADTAPVIQAVQAVIGGGDDAYYRSIAILLVNTAEQAGSTGYPYRDYKSGFVNGYASFAIAVLAANSTGTNGLVKHEAGGHAMGRLADEYYTLGNTASSANQTDLSNWHAKGWYWNVNPNNTSNYYKFTNSAYTSDEVAYFEGGWGYAYGMYRPTAGGMMQGSTGVFNAPSRHAIYHRIITETEGANAYSWSRFLEYDNINR